MRKGIHVSREKTYTEAEVQALLHRAISDTISRVYPIGSVYVTTKQISPESMFGGKWEQTADTFTDTTVYVWKRTE